MSNERCLAVTLLVTLLILTGEVVGGYLSNSLALLSDAGHMVTDALAIALGLVATRISRRPSGKTRHIRVFFNVSGDSQLFIICSPSIRILAL